MMLKILLGAATIVAVIGVVGALSMPRTVPARSAVRTDPGGSEQAAVFPSAKARSGNSLAAFSSGCFWGSEEAYRKVPGIIATAAGYAGGSSTYPSYEIAHQTGHLETVLVEFNPKTTSYDKLLKVFWTLPRSKSSVSQGTGNSSYRATIWFYNPSEYKLAVASLGREEQELHHKLAVNVLPAQTFYRAEDSHQQYDEKAGKDLCNVR
jgi:peptide-methionine (S)-S-oxide reductase